MKKGLVNKMFELLNKLNANGVHMELDFNFCGKGDIICHFRKKTVSSSVLGMQIVICKHELDSIENPDEFVIYFLLTKLDEFVKECNNII